MERKTVQQTDERGVFVTASARTVTRGPRGNCVKWPLVCNDSSRTEGIIRRDVDEEP